MSPSIAITNPSAGSHHDEAVAAALAVLRDGGLEVELAETSDPDELDAVLADRGERDLVVVGGDGSLHAVVAALARRDELAGPTIALVPLGTGNDFARGVGIPLDPEEAAGLVLSGSARGVDVLVDDQGEVVVNAVHVGVGAEAGLEAHEWKPRLGKLGYPVGALLAGIKTQGIRVNVEVDGVPVVSPRRRVLQVGVGNGAFVGGGTELAPDADPTDGAADIVVSFAVDRWQRLTYALHLSRGTHDDRHDVRKLRGTEVTVTGAPFWTNADGELKGPVSARTWTLHPAAIRMILP